MKYMVMHYSTNWMIDGLSVKWFTSLKEARKYLSNFQGSKFHKGDHARLVRCIEEHDAVELQTGVYGFKI